MTITYIEYDGDVFPDYKVTLSRADLKVLRKEGKLVSRSSGGVVTITVSNR